MNILIVDNSKVYAQILKTELQSDADQVYYFKSPLEALSSLDNITYGYICVAYYLQDMDGIEFAKKIRAKDNYDHTPIILFASKAEANIFKNAIVNGITDIFYKEDNFNELISHIIRMSRRKSKLCAKILYVEDSISQQRLMQHLFESAGFYVDVFNNARDAYQYLLKNEYDLVVTDIVLEGDISGIKFVNMIRRLQSEKGDIPILAVTAFDNLSRRIDLFTRGINDYVQKPIIQEEFFSRVDNLINNKRLIDLLREQRRIVEKISDEELRVMACAFESNDAIIIADPYNNIIRVNEAFKRISGYSNEEVLGENIWKFAYLGEIQGFESNYVALEKMHEVWEGNAKNIRKNGEEYETKIKISIIRNNSQEIRHYVVVFSDISTEKATLKKMHFNEYYDTLTGLPNRKLLMKELEKDFIRAKKDHYMGGLIFIQVHHFNYINDSAAGWKVVDNILVEITQRLSAIEANITTMIARVSGQKFVILISKLSFDTDKNKQLLHDMAKKVTTILSQPYCVSDDAIHLKSTIGITCYPSGQKSIHGILQQAELANYSAHRANQDIFFFSEEIHSHTKNLIKLESDLRKAIDNKEFVLHYQPQYDHNSRVIGAEVLIRWKHQNEWIPPSLFIPAAEQASLMREIGRWIMETAIEELLVWRSAEIIDNTFRLSVNVSPVQYMDDDFLASVETWCQKYPQIMCQIDLELTESIFIEKMDIVIEKMEVLRKYGIHIAIDDFGTGYSCLSYLKKLPLSYLKIDQSFVQDISIDKNNESIVETIISMAHLLNLKVIAEGVETERQLIFLRNRQCEFFQGYLFSKPLDAKEFQQLLHSYLSPQ